ncbi:MAG: hypothetical protein QW270_00950 [Candidatus Bathyarchaeia archaeon]
MKIVMERLENKKGNLPKKGVATWDVRARELFYRTMNEIPREKYKIKNIFVEGQNPFPGDKGKIFNSKLYPDAIIEFEDGQRIAIELDNGDHGSRIKNALAKAGMLKLVGGFHKVVVFFFTYGALEGFKPTQEKEQKVLEFYQENFSTWLFLV